MTIECSCSNGCSGIKGSPSCVSGRAPAFPILMRRMAEGSLQSAASIEAQRTYRPVLRNRVIRAELGCCGDAADCSERCP